MTLLMIQHHMLHNNLYATMGISPWPIESNDKIIRLLEVENSA